MDIPELKWRLTGTNVSCPQVLISAKFVNSNDHSQLIEDMRESEGKQILFPNIVASLTAEERDDLMEAIVMKLLDIRRRRIES